MIARDKRRSVVSLGYGVEATLGPFRVGMVLFVHAILAGIGLCKLWVIPSSNWKR